MKKVYAIESGKIEIQAATGLLIFNADSLSSLAFEDIQDAIKWIESRYGSPKQVGGYYVWQSYGTDNAYRIRFLDVVIKEEK